MSTLDFYTHFDKVNLILHSFAYKLTQDFDRARDLYQETAFRAFKNKEKFRTGTNFKAWLMTIMKNIFINDYRKKVKQNTILDKSDNNYFINSSGNAIENKAEGIILMKELSSLIDALEEGLRKPFLMHFEGYKYQEIAEEMNLPLGTIKSRIYFARKELKSQLSKRYDLELLRMY